MPKRGVNWANLKFLTTIKSYRLANSPLVPNSDFNSTIQRVLHPRFQSYFSMAILGM
jgi:hypothetical protein